MQSIKIIAPCKCQAKNTLNLVSLMLQDHQQKAEVAVSTDMNDLMKYGVMDGVAVVADDKVIWVGKEATPDDIQELFK